MICDLPNKLLLTVFFNVPVYFLSNLRREPGAFFTFCLFAFASLLTGSMIFRTIGAMSRTLSGSIAPGACFIYLLIIYTGFVLPPSSMHPWFRWFAYLNPIGYAFESLMINEVSFMPHILHLINHANVHSFVIDNSHVQLLFLEDLSTATLQQKSKHALLWGLKLGPRP